MKRYKPLVFLTLLFSIASISCNHQDAGGFDETSAKKEVWKAVETRFSTWKDNEFEKHMAVYHPDWRRWSLSTRKLMKKEDFNTLWDQMKNNEQVIELDLEPVEIVFYGDGNVAIAHFISTETYLWTGDAGLKSNGEPLERGSVQTITMRWSDVMVKEGDDWLYVGGHRDYGGMDEGD